MKIIFKGITVAALLLFFCMPAATYARGSEKMVLKEQQQNKKSEREAKKEAQRIADSIQFVATAKAIENGKFIILANRVQSKSGRPVNVNSNTNFIKVADDKATVQLAFEHVLTGANGLGGITVEGNIQNVELSYDKKGNLKYRMVVSGPAISADVFFTLPKNSTECNATVKSTFNSTYIKFSGPIKPYEGNEVFEGRKL